MDDVPALVEAYQASGGVVPLGVLVAEVEALQQAASRLRQTAAAYDVQLLQLEERAASGGAHHVDKRRREMRRREEREQRAREVRLERLASLVISLGLGRCFGCLPIQQSCGN